MFCRGRNVWVAETPKNTELVVFRTVVVEEGVWKGIVHGGTEPEVEEVGGCG